LRKLSAYRLRQQPHAATLQTTVLVNEVVLRLMPMIDRSGDRFPESRKDFLALTSHLMRCTLADYARKRKLPTVSLEGEGQPLADWRDEDLEGLVAVDQALKEIAHTGGAKGQRRSKAVELLVFGGMNYREIADELGISDDMARRDCQAGVAQIRQLFTEKPDEPAVQ
jgi:DNA-directed RNA polymerase specialized sigma24 family protein